MPSRVLQLRCLSIIRYGSGAIRPGTPFWVRFSNLWLIRAKPRDLGATLAKGAGVGYSGAAPVRNFIEPHESVMSPSSSLA